MPSISGGGRLRFGAVLSRRTFSRTLFSVAVVVVFSGSGHGRDAGGAAAPKRPASIREKVLQVRDVAAEAEENARNAAMLESEALSGNGASPPKSLRPPGKGEAFSLPKGLRTADDFARALEWHRRLADSGDAMGEYMLGQHYGNGLGVRKDAAKALEWYLRAAERGLAEARYEAGCAYLYGWGVKADSREAKKWLDQAAGQGHAAARLLRTGQKEFSE